LPTVELWGAIGGVACVVNKLLKHPHAHVVLQCNPVLLPTLQKNQQLNNSEFSIEPLALAYSPTVSFTISDHLMLGSIRASSTRTLTVKATTLQQVLTNTNFRL